MSIKVLLLALIALLCGCDSGAVEFINPAPPPTTEQPTGQPPIIRDGLETPYVTRVPFVEEVIMPEVVREGARIPVTLRLAAPLHPEILRYRNSPGIASWPEVRPGGLSLQSWEAHSPGYEIWLYLSTLEGTSNPEELGPLVDNYFYDFPPLPAGDYNLVIHSAKSRELGGVDVLYRLIGTSGPVETDNIKFIVQPFKVLPATGLTEPSLRTVALRVQPEGEATNRWNGRLVEGAAPLEVSSSVEIALSPTRDSGSPAEAIESVKIEYGEDNWVDVTEQVLGTWDLPENEPQRRHHFTFNAIGVYIMRVKVTFRDGEVIYGYRPDEVTVIAR